MNCYPDNRNKGLTLIELVIALAMLVILTGSVAGSFRLLDRRALNDASLTLQADMRFAQRMAMIEGRRWGILFNRRDSEYIIYHLDPRTVYKTVKLSNGVEIREFSAPDMVYLPRGTGSHGFRIWLAKGNYWQRLTATVSGGRVAVKEMQWSTGRYPPPVTD